MNSSLDVCRFLIKVCSPLICGVDGNKNKDSGIGWLVYECASTSRSLKPLCGKEVIVIFCFIRSSI